MEKSWHRVLSLTQHARRHHSNVPIAQRHSIQCGKSLPECSRNAKPLTQSRRASTSCFPNLFTEQSTVSGNALSQRVGQEITRRAALRSMHSAARTVQCGTVTSDRDGRATLDQLLGQVPRIVLEHDSSRQQITFLVTPSYASAAAHNPALFAGCVMSKEQHVSVEFDILVAVVDRLPSPSLVQTPTSTSRAGVNHRAFEDRGCEGVSYVVSSASDSPGVRSSERHHVLSTPKPASISFALYSDRVPEAQRDQRQMTRNDAPEHELRISLANTIFSTGERNYLHLRTWLLPGSKHPPSLLKDRTLHDHRVSLIVPRPTTPSKPYDLHIPLLPLTPRRTIQAAMGNILRQLITDPDSALGSTHEKAVQTASQELQAAVASYFTIKKVAQRQVALWALVRNPSMGESDAIHEIDTSIQQTWTSDPPRWANLHDSIATGAKLYRVVAGGGGWGKKAGLICLDPETARDESEDYQAGQRHGLDITDPDGTPELLTRNDMFVGRSIAFYIAPLEHDEQDHSQDMIRQQGDGSLFSMTFGVIPSTIDDAAPLMDTNDSEVAIEKTAEMAHFPNHFGALSESSLDYTVTSRGRSEGGTVTRRETTKIDIPFARFTVTNQVAAAHEMTQE